VFNRECEASISEVVSPFPSIPGGGLGKAFQRPSFFVTVSQRVLSKYLQNI
jgi:hypothetical protein